MPDKTLFCSAKRCAHNYDHECNAGYINMRGESAMSTPETTCTSFFDDSVMFLTSLIKCGSKTSPENIICEAKNCRYYNNKKCESDNVIIISNHFSCQTFDPIK
ncbi:MAG: DUF1540 domain-containing protein [Terrisporobacter sp.]|uniref:DUF1540 domain-containing protein n=1 Tax=Terrisporobacter sp. TaxID=1965305 RepID=UPI002FC9907A